MTFVTVSREFGSFGTTISRHVAQALHYDYIDKKTVEKVLDQYGLVTFHEFYASTHSFWEALHEGNKNIISVFNNTVLEFSKNNAVFVGRAGFVLLRDYENVFHVFIKAPFETRVSHIMETMKLSNRETAEDLVLRHDKARESYLKTFYKAKPGDAAPFSLVIDTSRVPAAMAEKWIVEAVRLLEHKEIDPQKSTLTITSDVVLQNTIAKVLHPA